MQDESQGSLRRVLGKPRSNRPISGFSRKAKVDRRFEKSEVRLLLPVCNSERGGLSEPLLHGKTS